MPPFVNKTGKRFGKLTAIRCEKRGEHYWWLCSCDCGNKEHWANAYSLRDPSKTTKKKGTLSCGCEANKGKPTHGGTNTIEYTSWKRMKQRCMNPNDLNYKHYGARGIKICKRWLGPKGFENFLRDMGKRPSKKFSIDRIDVNGDYTPKNCEWSTHKQQMRNCRNTIRLTWKNETLTLRDWSARTGIPLITLRRRYHKGMDVRKIFTLPI